MVNLLKLLYDKVLMNNKSPMNQACLPACFLSFFLFLFFFFQALFLNFKVFTSILSNLEKNHGSEWEDLLWGAQSRCQVFHTHGVRCEQPFWIHSLDDSHLAAEGHTPKEKGY